jgi:NADH-quinone oxidoreductase subunit L
MSDEQDMRKMGGIWRMIPITYAVMWIGSLALAGIGIPGVFGFAGFYSKDIVLEAAFGAHSSHGLLAFWLGIAAAFMTAFYSWRLLFLTFHGAPRADKQVMDHVHESPWVMLVPLILLSVGAVFAGVFAYDWFVGDGRVEFWGDSLLVLSANDSIEAAHHVPTWVKLLPLVMGVTGIALAWIMYIVKPGLPALVVSLFRPIHTFFFNKWYFDELYDWAFVRPAQAIGRTAWKIGDGAVIDGMGPDGIAATTLSLARRAGRLQSGYVYHYAFAMLIGVVILITWYLIVNLG